MASVRALPRRSNSVVFHQLPTGHAFRFYGQIFMKTSDEWAFSLTMRADISFGDPECSGDYGFRTNFHQNSKVIPIGRVEGFEVE